MLRRRPERESVERFFRRACPPVVYVAEGVERPANLGRKERDSSEHVVTYLGRISPEKKLHALVDAWQSIDKTVRQWLGFEVGWIPSKRMFEFCRRVGQALRESFRR